DNSSQSLARSEAATGKFKERAQSVPGAVAGQRGNETFFSPGWGEPGLVPKWERWYERVSKGGPVAGGAEGKAPTFSTSDISGAVQGAGGAAATGCSRVMRARPTREAA